jgi:hypothetical protein
MVGTAHRRDDNRNRRSQPILMGQAHLPARRKLAAVPGDPLASVDEPPTASTVGTKLAKPRPCSCHQIVIKLFFSCCANNHKLAATCLEAVRQHATYVRSDDSFS